MGYNNLGVSDPGSVISGLGAASAVGGAIGGPGAGIGGTSITPEQLSILLASLGKGLSPDNPMVGVGNAAADYAKSTIANQARQEDKADKKQWMDTLLKMMGGYTEKGTPGVNSMKSTIDADGNPEHTMNFNTAGNDPTTMGNKSLAPF